MAGENDAYVIKLTIDPTEAKKGADEAANAVIEAGRKVEEEKRKRREESRQSANPRGPSRPVYDVPSGPYQQLDEARRRHEQVAASGVDQRESVFRDAQYRMDQAQKRVNKIEEPPKPPKSREDLIMDAFLTSRVGPGGKLFPLINRLRSAGISDPAEFQKMMEERGFSSSDASKIAPMVAQVAKIAMPMLAAAIPGAMLGSAIYGAYRVAEAGSQRMRVGNAGYYLTGGDPSELGAVRSVGGQNGYAKAMQFAEAIRGGSYGAAYMRSKGIVDLGPWTIDKDANYLKGLDEFRKIRSNAEATRVARDLNITDDAWVRDLSDETYSRLKEARGNMGSPEERRAEAEYRAMKEMVSGAWDKSVRSTSVGFMRGLSNTLDPDFWFGNPLSKNWWEKHAGIGVSDNAASGSDDGSPSNANGWNHQKRPMPTNGYEMIGGDSRANSVPGMWHKPAYWSAGADVSARADVINQSIVSDAYRLGAFNS